MASPSVSKIVSSPKLRYVINAGQWRTEGGLGGSTPPPNFRSFEKIEPDCKLSRKCLVFLFQHPN